MAGEFQYVPGTAIQDLASVNTALTDWFNQTYSKRLGDVVCELGELTGLNAAEVSIALALPAVPQTATSDVALRLWCQARIQEAMPANADTPYLVRVAPMVEVATLDNVQYHRLRLRVYAMQT